MRTDSAFWFELRDAFRPLPKDGDATPDPWRDVFALWLDDDGHYKITDDLAAKEERAEGFRRLAEKAGLAAGEPNLASAADRWLDLIGAGRKLRTRELGPLSANYCARRGNEAFAREIAHPMGDIAVPKVVTDASVEAAVSADVRVLRITEALAPDLPTGGPEIELQSDAERRRAGFVDPILRTKGISRAKWAERAGVDPSVVYDYLKGMSSPRIENRKALAYVIGVPVNALPE